MKILLLQIFLLLAGAFGAGAILACVMRRSEFSEGLRYKEAQDSSSRRS